MKKATIEEIKSAINELPQSSLDKLLHFIESLKGIKVEKQPIKSYSFGGKFDSVDMRSSAY